MTAAAHRFKKGDRVILNPSIVAEWDPIKPIFARNLAGKVGTVRMELECKSHPGYEVFWDGYGYAFVYDVEIRPEGPADYTDRDEGGVV